MKQCLALTFCCCVLLLMSSDATTAAPAGDPSTHAIEVANLQQEVEELKQLLSMVLGAEPVDQMLGFLPGTTNTQRLVARQPELWPQHFTFLSAVAADSSVTCSHVMTDRSKLAGVPLYLVLGDQAGRLYFFTQQGHLMHEYDTGISSSITALSSDLVKHNESHLLVGQHDGSVSVLTVAHEHPRLPDGSGIRAVTPLMVSMAADRAQQRNDTDISSHVQPIRHIMFGMSSTRRMLLAVDASGRVVLMAASSGHMMMVQHVTAGPPLAININSQFQIVVQTESATSIMLMKRGRNLVTKRCSGLEQPHAASHEHEQPAGGSHEHGHGDRLLTAVFDPTRAFRAFGVTAGGELVVLVVPSGMAAHHCRVVQRVPLGLPPGPVHLVMGKGRLVLLHSAGVAAFNLSAHKVQLPGSYMVSHTWQQLWRLYGLTQQHKQLLQPLRDSSMSESAGWEEGSSSEETPSSSSGADGVLQTSAWDSPLMAATASHGLLLLPFGSRGMAVFAVGQGRAAAGAGLGAGGGGGVAALSSSSGGGSGSDFNWARVLQPFVVIMMIIVGVWQFVRASSRSNLATRRAGRYSAGLAGLDDMGVMSRSQGLAASFMMQGELNGQRRPGLGLGDDDEGLGSFNSLDRNFGAYAGPRGRPREQQASAGPLGALTARRRARAAMFSGRQAEREQADRSGAGLRRRGPTAGAALGGSAGQRQYDGSDRLAGRADRHVAAYGDSISEGEEEGEDVNLLQQQQQPQPQSSGDEAEILQGGVDVEQPGQQLSEGGAEEGVAEVEGLIADASAHGPKGISTQD